MRFVFPGEMDVADLLLHECRRRAAGAEVEDRRLPVELGHEREGVGLRAAALGHCATRRKEAELAVPGRLRVRRDDLDARLHDVRPILDVLRIALANDEHDRRRVRARVVGKFLLPSVVDELGLADRVGVGPHRERHDVGVEAVDDGARLRARAAVRLFDLERRARALLVGGDEVRVDVAPQLARRVVGDVQQRQ